MSRPAPLLEPPDGYFQLTDWKPLNDAASRGVRDRWRASLAVLGIRSVEVEQDDQVALFREGEEACSRWTAARKIARGRTRHGGDAA